MIAVAFHVEGHTRDSVFDMVNSVHAYYPTRFFRSIRNELTQLGFSVHTADLFLEQGVRPKIDLFFEADRSQQVPRGAVLIAMENPLLSPLNRDFGYLSQFSKVLSWNKSLLHLPNFQVLTYSPLEEVSPSSAIPQSRKFFSTMICSNKVFKRETEGDLYSERVQVINWFERNAAEDLRLYGLGWHKPPHERTLRGKVLRSLRRVRANLSQTPCYATWRGPLPNKKTALLEAWFCFCYENTSSLPGYITEKMLDALAVGCIPVYLGAPDVRDYLSPKVFVDVRNYSSIDALISYMRSISISSRIDMLHEGNSFISESRQFSFEENVQIIVKSIIGSLGSRP